MEKAASHISKTALENATISKIISVKSLKFSTFKSYNDEYRKCRRKVSW